MIDLGHGRNHGGSNHCSHLEVGTRVPIPECTRASRRTILKIPQGPLQLLPHHHIRLLLELLSALPSPHLCHIRSGGRDESSISMIRVITARRGNIQQRRWADHYDYPDRQMSSRKKGEPRTGDPSGKDGT